MTIGETSLKHDIDEHHLTVETAKRPMAPSHFFTHAQRHQIKQKLNRFKKLWWINLT